MIKKENKQKKRRNYIKLAVSIILLALTVGTLINILLAEETVYLSPEENYCEKGSCTNECGQGEIATPGSPEGFCNLKLIDSIPIIDYLHKNKQCTVCTKPETN
ncbi:MAG: hypothetical protein AABW73_00035 [Nanoarchaeota archaeon]|mgnify:CR=1 FL=1